MVGTLRSLSKRRRPTASAGAKWAFPIIQKELSRLSVVILPQGITLLPTHTPDYCAASVSLFWKNAGSLISQAANSYLINSIHSSVIRALTTKVRSRLPRSEPFVGRARSDVQINGTGNISWKFEKRLRSSSAHDLAIAVFAASLTLVARAIRCKSPILNRASPAYPRGMLWAGGDSRRVISSCVPRVWHQEVVLHHRSMQAARCAVARSPSPIRNICT